MPNRAKDQFPTIRPNRDDRRARPIDSAAEPSGDWVRLVLRMT